MPEVEAEVTPLVGQLPSVRRYSSRLQAWLIYVILFMHGNFRRRRAKKCCLILFVRFVRVRELHIGTFESPFTVD